MAVSKKAKGILIYNLLMKEVTKINKHLPEDRKLSVQDRRKLISTKIYPKYKGQSKSRIRLTPLREKLINTIRRIPKRPGCDVLAIPQDTYQDIPYYEIEQLIGSIFPNCIYVKVDAKNYGSTNVFNTRDFNYYSTGLSEITNRINTDSRNKGKNTSTIPEYNGIIMLRSGKKNDGTPDNYYLEMVLTTSGSKRMPGLKIPFQKKTKKQQGQAVSVKNYVRQRIKAMKQEKSVFKKIRYRVSTAIGEMERMAKSKNISNATKQTTINEIYKGISKEIDKKYKEDILSERKHKSIQNSITSAFKKAVKGKGKNNKT